MKVAWIAIIAACMVHAQAFEAASVKALPAGTRFAPITRDVGRFSAPATNLQVLIGFAYGVGSDQVIGPDWLSSEMYSVAATFTSAEQFGPVMQNLLAERFHLAIHRETKTIDGYDLVIAKGGPKLKESAADSQPGGQGQFGPHGATIRLSKQSMVQFAAQLPMRIRQAEGQRDVGMGPIRVIDKTGLTANYDFSFHYAREGDEDPGPDFYSALESQLGLKLQPVKMPLEFIVVDHVEKAPGEN